MKKWLLVLTALVYLAIPAYIWYRNQESLPSSNQSAATIAAELSGLSPQAQISLITEPEDGAGELTQAIDGAQKTIDLVIYELEDPQIEQQLVAAEKRGVQVRVILQNLDTFGKHPNQEAFDFLKSQGVPVQWAPPFFSLTHQKTLIVDGARAFIMTFNLTPQYYASSRDFAVVDDGSQDVGAIEKAFSNDWNNTQRPADKGEDLVWSPGSADMLLALIHSATSSLDIYNEEMADSRIMQALMEAAARGVHVRVDMTYATNWKSALQTLAGAGVDVRTYASTAKLYIHAKVIVADDSKAFVGSENFSAQSLDSNRELGILVARPDIVSSLETTYEKDWMSSRPFAVESSIKLSATGICHTPGDAGYTETQQYTAYATLDDCLSAGGQLSANYKN